MVEEFERVVRIIGQDFDFAWVDVACIDQENDEVKMDEIGNQMGIFKQARRVYAWLSRSSTDDLQACMNSLYAEGDNLRMEFERWRKNVRSLDGLPEMIENMRAILRTLERVFSDPWVSLFGFRSIKCTETKLVLFVVDPSLQESVLRRDARLLSHESDPISMYLHGETRNMLFVNFVGRCSKIYDDVSRVMHSHRGKISVHGRPEAIALSENISKIVERAGYHYAYFCSNPSVQYSVAQFRETKYPLDRIYGIMQLYSFRLGAADRNVPPHSYTLEDLEVEFAQTLILKSPLLSQLFVHTRTTKPRKSWQITQYSKVPYDLMDFDKSAICCEDFSVGESGRLSVRGQTCALEPLVDAWDRIARNTDIAHWAPLNGRIFLDDFEETRDHLDAFPKSDNSKAFDNVIELTAGEVSAAGFLLRKFGEDSLRAFLIGFTGEEVRGNFGQRTRLAVGLVLLL